MRLSCTLLACILTLAMWPASGTAKSAKELISDLQAALRDEAAQQKSAPGDSGSDRRDSMIPYLTQQLDGQLVRGDNDTASILAQINASSRSDKVEQICRELGEQLQAERERKEADFVAAADAAVKHVGEGALRAKEEKDMDAVLQEIGRLHADRYEQNSELARRAASKLQSASQFASRWQDYLADLKSGNLKAAREVLQNLSQNISYPIVARSEILTRMQTVSDAEANAAKESTSSIPAKVDALCQSVRTPADIARALPELKALRQEFPSDVDSTRISELDGLASFYQQIQAGLNTPVNLLTNAHYYTELRLQLILLTLPRYLEVSDRFSPLPQDTVGAFLDRVTADAKKTANWPLLLKTVEASRSIAWDGSAYRGGMGSSALDSLRAFIVGQNEEQAAQYASAVASYEAALKDTEALVPVATVRDRLATIKHEHPAEFEEGTQRAFNPPVSSRYPPGYAPPPPARPTPPAAPGR